MRLQNFATSLALAAGCCLFSAQALAGGSAPNCSGKSFASNGEVRLAYTVEGRADGEAVILVPGSGQHAEDWPRDLTQALLKDGYRIIKLDPRDVGCSTHLDAKGPVDWPALFAQLGKGQTPSVPYGVGEMAADVISVMDQAGAKRAHLVGASAGATVAAWLASDQPQRVSSLVLLMANSGNLANPMPADPVRMASAGMPPGPDAGTAERRKFLAAMTTALEADAPTRTAEELEAWLDIASARRLDGDGLARTGAAMLAAGDLRARFASISSPTLVVHGGKDPLVPVAAGKEVAEAVPGAQWHLEPEMGHAINNQAVSVLTAFIKRN